MLGVILISSGVNPVQSMSEVTQLGTELAPDERNLLSVAYKNVVGSWRSSWRVISSLEQKRTEEEEDLRKLTRAYRCEIEEKLKAICSEVLVRNIIVSEDVRANIAIWSQELLDNYLIPTNKEREDTESEVFYKKMKGDYYRYLAEVATDKKESAKKANEAYDNAFKSAEKLSPTHPIRLGLALNFSVFYYEIESDSEHACEMAKKVLMAVFAFMSITLTCRHLMTPLLN